MTPRTIDSAYEWLPEGMTQLCVFTDADLVPNRLSILRTDGWPVHGNNVYSSYERMTPFRTDDLFPNRISILLTKYIFRTDSLYTTGLFIPRSNDSPYDWLPVRMTPRTNDSTFCQVERFLTGRKIFNLQNWLALSRFLPIRQLYRVTQGYTLI